MSDNNFKDLVAKLNSISDNTVLAESVEGTPYTQTASEAVNGVKDTANILHKFDIIGEADKPDFLDLDNDGDTEEPMKKAASEKKGKVAAKAKEVDLDEDVVADIKSRYADFLKSEVAQGSDLGSITSAVEEGTSTASAISTSFDRMFGMMNRLTKITGDGGVLVKMVEREGGDPSYVADANQKLEEAMKSLEEAHMYSQPMSHEDEE